MSEPKKSPSPSRTYVAVCNKGNFSGYYLRKFVLPEDAEENSLAHASWYFLNRLNFEACLEFVMTFEDYQNLTPEGLAPR